MISGLVYVLGGFKVSSSNCLNSKNLPSKVNFSRIFFGHSITSEVKGHLYKVKDNLVNYEHKNFRSDIWTGLCVR